MSSAAIAPRIFRAAAIVTFLTGSVLHGLRLLLGGERLSDVFTPPMDGAFGVVMLVAAVSGWLSLGRQEGGRAARVGFLFALGLITLSVPIHLRAWLVWSTAYIKALPSWYSAVEIPMFLGLAFLMTRLRFR
jgi:hypothetical protein